MVAISRIRDKTESEFLVTKGEIIETFSSGLKVNLFRGTSSKFFGLEARKMYRASPYCDRIYCFHFNSSGVYICKSIVNYLRHGNYICKSEGIVPGSAHSIARRSSSIPSQEAMLGQSLCTPLRSPTQPLRLHGSACGGKMKNEK